MTTLNTLPWNLVTRNLHGPARLRKKLHEKITLHSEKSAPDIISAFDNAVKALLRELQSLKADLRRERFWKRKERRKTLRQLKATGFAAEPMAEGTGPQKFEDVIRELLREHYAELLRHVGRHIRHDEMAGEIPKGALDARDIVDEVARQALTQASQRPNKMNWLVWFYSLIHLELRRQRRALKQAQAEEVSLEELKVLPDNAEKASGYDAERPLDIIAQELAQIRAGKAKGPFPTAGYRFRQLSQANCAGDRPPRCRAEGILHS